MQDRNDELEDEGIELEDLGQVVPEDDDEEFVLEGLEPNINVDNRGNVVPDNNEDPHQVDNNVPNQGNNNDEPEADNNDVPDIDIRRRNADIMQAPRQRTTRQINIANAAREMIDANIRQMRTPPMTLDESLEALDNAFSLLELKALADNERERLRAKGIVSNADLLTYKGDDINVLTLRDKLIGKNNLSKESFGTVIQALKGAMTSAERRQHGDIEAGQAIDLNKLLKEKQAIEALRNVLKGKGYELTAIDELIDKSYTAQIKQNAETFFDRHKAAKEAERFFREKGDINAFAVDDFIRTKFGPGNIDDLTDAQLEAYTAYEDTRNGVRDEDGNFKSFDEGLAREGMLIMRGARLTKENISESVVFAKNQYDILKHAQALNPNSTISKKLQDDLNHFIEFMAERGVNPELFQNMIINYRENNIEKFNAQLDVAADLARRNDEVFNETDVVLDDIYEKLGEAFDAEHFPEGKELDSTNIKTLISIYKDLRAHEKDLIAKNDANSVELETLGGFENHLNKIMRFAMVKGLDPADLIRLSEKDPEELDEAIEEYFTKPVNEEQHQAEEEAPVEENQNMLVQQIEIPMREIYPNQQEEPREPFSEDYIRTHAREAEVNEVQHENEEPQLNVDDDGALELEDLR